MTDNRRWRTEPSAERKNRPDFRISCVKHNIKGMTKAVMVVRHDHRTVCYTPRAARRPVPSRRRPFRFSNRALVTSFDRAGPQMRRASVCGSAAALRSGYDSLNTSLRPPLHFPRSPTADRSQNPNPLRTEA
jgi:hypothetical protein